MVVLRGIPALLSPELLFAMAGMGHGDEIGKEACRNGRETACAKSPAGKGERAVAKNPTAKGETAWAESPAGKWESGAKSPGVLADANFPAASVSRCGPVLVRADGLGIPQLLEAILKLLPLDTYVDSPAAVMDLVEDDKKRRLETPVWAEYKRLLSKAGSESDLEKVERFTFYERAKKAFAVVATGETALYGNLILKKGVLSPEEQS